ncbi:hypothetical protein Tco_1362404 [Tanacetum coccineum]
MVLLEQPIGLFRYGASPIKTSQAAHYIRSPELSVNGTYQSPELSSCLLGRSIGHAVSGLVRLVEIALDQDGSGISFNVLANESLLKSPSRNLYSNHLPGTMNHNLFSQMTITEEFHDLETDNRYDLVP